MTAGWQFTEISPIQSQYVPREEEIPKKYHSLSEALVREFIQNALDARVGEKLSVRVSFGKCVSPIRWLEGLYEHIEACRRETHLKLPIDPTCCLYLLPGAEWTYLVMEEIKTRGLTGETGNSRHLPEESDFYDFVYWEGGSRKAGAKGGRWGVGKMVYHMCSRARAFFALTERYDDGRHLLTGKCVLVPHTLNNTRFGHDGYFREEDGRPIEDRRTIEEFSKDFGLKRTEPGLSLVVPIRSEEITPDSIKSAVVSHWFYPIAQGTLSVQIITPDKQVDINSQTLDTLANQLDWKGTWWKNRNGEDIEKLLRFVFRCTRADPVDLPIDSTHPDFAQTVQQIGEIRERYLMGETLAFRVPLEVRVKGGETIRSFFFVNLERDESLRNADEFYIRSDILVPGVAGQLRGRCARVLLVANDSGIARFLGDAETPFHDDWNARTMGFSETYENAVRTLGSVKRSPLLLVDALEGLSREEKSWELFKDYFSLAEEAISRGPVMPPKPRPEVKPGVRLIEPHQVEGGFILHLTPEGKTRLPLTVSIKLAYATLTGNPLRNYKATDFDVGSLPVRFQGCSIRRRELNLIELEITDPDFRLEAGGFDKKRELEVRLEVVKYGG